jgi:hypothetical protein
VSGACLVAPPKMQLVGRGGKGEGPPSGRAIHLHCIFSQRIDAGTGFLHPLPQEVEAATCGQQTHRCPCVVHVVVSACMADYTVYRSRYMYVCGSGSAVDSVQHSKPYSYLFTLSSLLVLPRALLRCEEHCAKSQTPYIVCCGLHSRVHRVMLN